MSFILDALKKSETDRQQHSPAEFANVPTGDDTPRAPRWLWALGALLAINLVVLLSLVLRADDPTPAVIAASEQALPVNRNSGQAGAATASFETLVEQAQRNLPKRQVALTPEPRQTAELAAGSEGNQAAPAARLSATDTTRLPTVQEVIVNGTVDIPDLHLDIHVYSDKPEERFVFINMSKQREKSQLREGPTVEEITRDGVVLEYRGTSFVLRRD